jgi:hypothetical protein
MKNFFIQVFKLAVICYILFWLLDAGFTYVFKKGNYTKIQWLDKIHDQNFDFAVHGSSRGYTSLDLKKIHEVTGQTGINISVDGSSITDQYLMLKLFIRNNNKVKRLYLQIDPFSSDTEEVFDFAVPKFFPYLKDPMVFDHFKQFGYQWYAYRYIPFYRYAKYNTLWGFHEVLNDWFSILPQDFDEYGDFYYPDVKYDGPKKLRDLTFDLNSKFKFLNQTISYCQKNGIKLILFTAPVADIRIDKAYADNIKAFKEKMSKSGVEYYNYGDLYKNDPKFFYNEIHLNKSGTDDFTLHMLKIM